MNENEVMQGRNPLIVVGCGGVLYHGLPEMMNMVRCAGFDTLVLVDPDSIEEKNGARQWGGVELEDCPKVTAAHDVVYELGFDGLCYALWTKLDPLKGGWFKDVLDERWPNLVQATVVSLPDGHAVRRAAHYMAGLLCNRFKVPVLSITAGNGDGRGYAYSSKWLPGPEGPMCIGDWLYRHRDIEEEADAELAELADTESCADDPGPDQQTVVGNVLTAVCVWQLVACYYLKPEPEIGEAHWNSEGEHREVKRMWTKTKKVIEGQLVVPYEPVFSGETAEKTLERDEAGIDPIREEVA